MWERGAVGLADLPGESQGGPPDRWTGPGPQVGSGEAQASDLTFRTSEGPARCAESGSDELGPSECAAQPTRASSILIVEDHELLAEALVLALSARGFDGTVARLSGPVTVLEQAAQLRPALVLLDLNLDDADGLDLIPGLCATGARVLVVTGCTDESRVGSALALGASGWVSKAQPFETLLDAAEAVLRNRPLPCGARYGDLVELGTARLQAQRELKQLVAQLTARERQVLWALSEGKSAAEIARTFFVSVGTVRTHIQAILSKLGVSSQLAAVARARLLLTPDDAPRRHG